MRGADDKQPTMYTLRTPEKAVPGDHPLRAIKKMADEALRALGPTFDAMYSRHGRGSVPPERLLKSILLMALYSVRSERLFCEQLRYNLLFMWFLDMNADEEPFNHSSFSKNRPRLLEHQVAQKFFHEVVEQARAGGLMSDEHFTVDGTLIEAWAALKTFRPKDEEPKDRPPPDDPGNPTVDFHGEKRSNETHVSTTDPESRLARKGKGKEAKLSFSAHALMENRNGMLVDFRVDKATGDAERWNALKMLNDAVPGNSQITVGGDKGYDTFDFVSGCRALGVTPHVAQNLKRSGGSGIDERTTRHPGYAISQVKRKLVEEIFGWMKTIGGFRRTRFKGLARTGMAGYLVGAAYNLLRMARLLDLEAAA
jgi:transposase